MRIDRSKAPCKGLKDDHWVASKVARENFANRVRESNFVFAKSGHFVKKEYRLKLIYITPIYTHTCIHIYINRWIGSCRNISLRLSLEMWILIAGLQRPMVGDSVASRAATTFWMPWVAPRTGTTLCLHLRNGVGACVCARTPRAWLSLQINMGIVFAFENCSLWHRTSVQIEKHYERQQSKRKTLQVPLQNRYLDVGSLLTVCRRRSSAVRRWKPEIESQKLGQGTFQIFSGCHAMVKAFPTETIKMLREMTKS